MRRHHRELIVYARALTGGHHSAQDVVQESFVTAHRKFADFDHERDFGAWMRGIVRLKSREWLRRQNRAPMPEAEIDQIEAEITTWQESRLKGTGTVFESLENCLNLLPDRLKEAVQAFYYKDQNGDEAAIELGIHPASLRKRLERARAQLHACISRKINPETSSRHV